MFRSNRTYCYVLVGILLLMLSASLPIIRTSWASYQNARKVFQQANKLARKGKYKQSIRLFQRISELVRDNEPKSVKARWEANFRIAELQLRLEKFRDARATLATLWRSSPEPINAYRKRLRQQFIRLEGKLLPELVLQVSPPKSKVVVRDRSGIVQPRISQRTPKQLRLYYDVQVGLVTVQISTLGHQSLQHRVVVSSVRSIHSNFRLRKLEGLQQARAYLEEARRLYAADSLAQAYSMAQRADSSIHPHLRITPQGQDLVWNVRLEVSTLQALLGKTEQANHSFRQLWSPKLSPARKNQIRESICRLHIQHKWPVPSLKGFSPCKSGGISNTSKTNHHPNSPPSRVSRNIRVKTLSPSGWTWTLWGLGIAGMTGGGVLWYLAKEAHQRRNDTRLPYFERARANQDYNEYLQWTWIALGSGGALLTAGLLVYLLHDFNRIETKTVRVPASPPPPLSTNKPQSLSNSLLLQTHEF